MKIVSTTLAGPGSASTIGDALRSVDAIADAFTVIVTSEDNGPISATVANFPWWTDNAKRVRFAHFEWEEDLAAARNVSFYVASGLDPDWVLVVDADERVECSDPVAMRAFLESTHADVVALKCSAEDGERWARACFFRMPANAKWAGEGARNAMFLSTKIATAPASVATCGDIR